MLRRVRRATVIIGIALLAAVPVGIDTTAAGVPVTAAAKAELRLAGGAPPALRGTHFQSRSGCD